MGFSCKQIWKWSTPSHPNDLRSIVHRPNNFTKRGMLVKFEVNEFSNVGNAQILKSISTYSESAVHAARLWKFLEPGRAQRVPHQACTMVYKLSQRYVNPFMVTSAVRAAAFVKPLLFLSCTVFDGLIEQDNPLHISQLSM